VACAHREQQAARPRHAGLTGQLLSSTARSGFWGLPCPICSVAVAPDGQLEDAAPRFFRGGSGPFRPLRWGRLERCETRGLRLLLAADGGVSRGKPSLSTYLRRWLMCVASFARPYAGLLVLVQSKHELGDRRGRPLRHGMQASPRSTRVAGRARAHASANRRRPFRPAARPSTGRPGGAKLRSRNRRAASPV
jgi:hypothetical protein